MRKVFVVPYFGKFPNYIQLWLDSCGRNGSFNWVLITDCELYALNIPSNVFCIKSTLDKIEDIFKKKIHPNIILTTPYKLCDYRPAYWMILDSYEITYDYWGYCDIDLIFGDLSVFIQDKVLMKYDKFLSNGHLTLYSSKEKIKNAFQLTGSKYLWKDIYFIEKNIGFDEHHGINKIFKFNQFNCYKNISIVADIDPQFKNFYLYYQAFNYEKQYFSLEDGKVLQHYMVKNKIYEREFAYIHIQKRKMTLNLGVDNSNSFLINDNGFSSLSLNKKENFKIFGEKFKVKLNKLRTKLRFYKNRFMNVV